MRMNMSLIVVAVTAAATYFVTIDDASAQSRRNGGGNKASVSRGPSISLRSTNSGRSSFTSSSNSNRSFIARSGNSSSSNNRRFTDNGSSNNSRRFTSNSGNNGNNGNSVRRFTDNSSNNNSRRFTSNSGNTARAQITQRNQASILSPNQRSSLGANLPRTGNVANVPRNLNPLAGNNRGNPANLSNNGRSATTNITTNTARQSNTANTLATNLRNNAGILRSTPALPSRLTVAAAGLRLGRIAPPANLITKLSLSAPKQGFVVNRFKPFLQRHWRSAFFWIAIPTVGYLTVPDHAYERFVTFVSGQEPDYDGAVTYLSQVAVAEESSRVVRLAPSEVPEVRHVVEVAPAPVYDQRFAPFVNRKWNTDIWSFSVPRIGIVTCPVALRGQVQELLAQSPPKYDNVLALIEEAAAADTVVDEGALADAEIETIQ